MKSPVLLVTNVTLEQGMSRVDPEVAGVVRVEVSVSIVDPGDGDPGELISLTGKRFVLEQP